MDALFAWTVKSSAFALPTGRIAGKIRHKPRENNVDKFACSKIVFFFVVDEL